MILACHNIEKAFGEREIVRDGSFHIEDREKAALVGVNGAGKSTILKMIIGEEPLDGGDVILAKGKTLGYLAQRQDLKSGNTIYEEVKSAKADIFAMEAQIRSIEHELKHLEGEELQSRLETYNRLQSEFDARNGYACESEITGVLKGLGFTEDDFNKQTDTLSGGQKTRVSLGKLLLTSPDILLLDEPTNHLDLNSIAWLETYLINYSGAVFIVSHDRYFLNRVVTKVVEIDNAQVRMYLGNYKDYAMKKQQVRDAQLKEYMNQQREIIYGQRRKVLDGEDISTEMHNMLRENIDSSCKQFLAGDVKDEWDFGALRRHYQGWLTTDADFHYTVADFDNLSQQGIADMLYDRGMQILQAKEVRYGAPVMRELERICLLKCVDRQWMDHIDNMDQLRQGIALRGYGQKDPVVEYRIEGFDMFDQMVDSIRESSVKMLLTIELRAAGAAPKREQVAKPTGEGFVPGNGAPGVKGSPKGQPVRVVKIGRNDPCPCGSGLKFKKCTCAQYHPTGNNGGEE